MFVISVSVTNTLWGSCPINVLVLAGPITGASPPPPFKLLGKLVPPPAVWLLLWNFCFLMLATLAKPDAKARPAAIKGCAGSSTVAGLAAALAKIALTP